MKWLLFTVSVITTGMETVSAQTAPGLTGENTFTIGTAYKRLEDHFILSYPATGNTVNVGYHFIKNGIGQKVTISMEGSIGSLSNRYTNVKTQALVLNFSQGFSMVKSVGAKLAVYSGYSIHAAPSFIKASDEDETRHSWSSFNDLSLYQSFVYSSGRNKITWDINLPVIGLASRPPLKSSYYNTTNGLLYDSYSNIFFTSWKNHRALSSSLDIRRALNEQIHIILGARVAYNKLQNDYFYKETQIGLYGGISLSLK
jgi:hypothetical protein